MSTKHARIGGCADLLRIARECGVPERNLRHAVGDSARAGTVSVKAISVRMAGEALQISSVNPGMRAPRVVQLGSVLLGGGYLVHLFVGSSSDTSWIPRIVYIVMGLITVGVLVRVIAEMARRTRVRLTPRDIEIEARSLGLSNRFQGPLHEVVIGDIEREGGTGIPLAPVRYLSMTFPRGEYEAFLGLSLPELRFVRAVMLSWLTSHP